MVKIIFGGSAKFPLARKLLDQYVARFLENPGLVKLALSSAWYSTALGAVRGSLCLLVHQGNCFVRVIVRNVNESRGAELVGSADFDKSP